MAVNFFSLYFLEGKILPTIKEGVKVILKNNIMYLNGVCSKELFERPQERTLEDTNIDKLFFLYPNNSLWVAKEEDGNFYLYNGNIDENNLYLTDKINKDKVYLAIEAGKTDKITVDYGRIITRVFEGDIQTCIVAVEEGSNIIIKGPKNRIIVEWDGKKFLYK